MSRQSVWSGRPTLLLEYSLLFGGPPAGNDVHITSGLESEVLSGEHDPRHHLWCGQPPRGKLTEDLVGEWFRPAE